MTMRFAGGLSLIVVLATVWPTAAQSQPIAGAIQREATRLAHDPYSSTTGVPFDDWVDVERLRPGTLVRVTTSAGTVEHRLIAAGPYGLVLYKGAALTIRPSDLDRIAVFFLHHPDALGLSLQQDAPIEEGSVRAERGSIYVSRRELLAAGTLERIAFEQVLMVRTWGDFRWSRAGAAGGGATGFLLGSVIYLATMFKQCGDSCTDERVMMNVAFFGFPAAGALIGGRAFGHRESIIVYRTRAARSFD